MGLAQGRTEPDIKNGDVLTEIVTVEFDREDTAFISNYPKRTYGKNRPYVGFGD